MKIRKVIFAIAIAMVCSQCKSPTQVVAPTSSASLSEVARTLGAIDSVVISSIDSMSGNVHQAFNVGTAWAAKQPNVQSASLLDSSYLYVTLNSGLNCMYFLDEVDDQGMSLVRGGGPIGSLGQHDRSLGLHEWTSPLSNHTISNLKVLLFLPVFDEFYTPTEFQSVLDRLNNSGLNLSVTVKKDSECTSDVIDHIGDYGFVILDTHGAPNGFLTGMTLPDTIAFTESEKIETAVNLGETAYDKFQAGQLMLARGLTSNVSKPTVPITYKRNATFRVLLTSKYISGLPKDTGTVIFGNMCYSGQSEIPAAGIKAAIQPAFLSLSPISYYGYAYATGGASRVSNEFAKQMEDSMISVFIGQTDSTGHCYLQPGGTEFYDVTGLGHYSTQKLFFKHWGANDFSYMKCGDKLTDARDGQKYSTVCIGNQVWMAQNLNYATPSSTTYNSDPTNGPIYGRLYTWSDAMQGAPTSAASPSGIQGVCPKGWHIPSKPEVDQLVNFLGGTTIAGGKLKDTSSLWFSSPPSPNVGATNSSGFSALPGGYNDSGIGSNINLSGFFWTTTEWSANTLDAYNLVLYIGNSNAGVAGGVKTLGESCRCVKDP